MTNSISVRSYRRSRLVPTVLPFNLEIAVSVLRAMPGKITAICQKSGTRWLQTSPLLDKLRDLGLTERDGDAVWCRTPTGDAFIAKFAELEEMVTG